jgi:hypothetical protein
MRFAVPRSALVAAIVVAAVCAASLARAAPAARVQDAKPPEPPSLAVQVNGAIDRGVAYLRSQQQKDGTFRCTHWCPVGTTALATYALLKSGVAPSDPAVTKSMDWLRYQPFVHTYAAAVVICAFDALGSKSDERFVVAGGDWLEKHQHESGLWGYPDKRPDVSNSQYAALGMWVAERHGFKAKRETWAKLLKELVRIQNGDGGFGYHEGDVSSGSMTTAGIAMLLLATERVAGDERFGTAREKGKAALARAWKWLEQFFTVEGNPHGDRTVVPESSLYYLFGVERDAAIGDRKQIGTHDWYPEGARHICRIQGQDGVWHDCDGTSFALLFLRRATFTGMHHDADDAGAKAASGAAAGAPNKPRPLVPYWRRWLVCGPLADPKHELLDAPYAGDATVEPSVGAAFRSMPWVERRELHDLVELGALDTSGDVVKPVEHSLSYAFTWLHAERDADVVLWFGADDGARLLLDGKPLFARHVHEVAARDKFSVPVSLSAGVHRLLLKIDNAGGGSGFYLRVAHADGSSATEVRPSLSKSDPQLAATALAMPGLFKLKELRELLPPLPRLDVDFKNAKELELFAIDRNNDEADHCPRWIDELGAKPVAPTPSPGARGILVVAPQSSEIAARILFKAKVPAAPSRLSLRVSPEVVGAPGRGDFVLRVGVLAESSDKPDWLVEQTIGPDSTPDPRNWRLIEPHLDAYANQDVLFLIECAAGGKEPWFFEHAFFDEIAVR